MPGQQTSNLKSRSSRFSALGNFHYEGIPPPLQHFFTHNISKNRHMKYRILSCGLD